MKYLATAKGLAKDTRAKVIDWCQRGGYGRRYFYYRFLSGGFNREQDAVGAGIAEYRRRVNTGSELYLLRRNIHMMEKGLTMQPRRNLFAAAYNQQTVDSYCAVLGNLSETAWINSEEFKWMTSVLYEYFEVTRPSGLQQIMALENKFTRAIESINQRSCDHGPLHPEVGPSPVSIDELVALAERRRSVRWFQDRAVDRRIVENAIKVAQEAPTACNRQPYRFEVFDTKDDVVSIAGIPMGTAGYAHQIPGIIVVIGDLSAFADERDRHLIYIDGGLATMGLLLGFEAQGVSTCVINWPDIGKLESKMKRRLQLAGYERVVMLVAYGHADPKGLVPYSAKRPASLTRLPL